jgi:hypothetical protein
VIHDDPFAGHDVRRDGAERDREIIEALHLRDGQRERAQRLRELLALYEAPRQPELPAFEAQRKLDQKALILELAAEIEVDAGRTVAKGVLPVDGLHDAFDVGGVEARGI